MKAVIIDDEALMRNNLYAIITKHLPAVDIVGEAEGVQSGLKLLNEIKPELLFLDVEMKDGTGFDLLTHYNYESTKVIFVTGHDRHAIKAFKFSAIDYVLKPVDSSELKIAVEKAEGAISQKDNLKTLVNNYEGATKLKKLLLKDNQAVYVVDVDEIVRCESQNNYTLFCLNDGREILISKTLKEYDRLLTDHHFFRTHQSHLINLAYFDKYEKRDGGMIYMKNRHTVPVSIKKKEELFQKLEQL